MTLKPKPKPKTKTVAPPNAKSPQKPKASGKAEAAPVSQIDPDQVAKLYAVLNSAGLGGLKIASIHLTPEPGGMEAARACHSVQLPNGHWTIVCD